jgi:nanoRNase/pAp phosphatase (c-di-AMP/oligoRNAs hydrolase)
MFATELGAYLRKKKPPFALVARVEGDGAIRVSLRSEDGFDVSAIARKYGGNGHPGAAAFLIPAGAPLPWTVVK